MALPKQNRLGSARDFARVHRRGVRAASNHLAVRALRLNSKASRLPKPVLKSAMQSVPTTDTTPLPRGAAVPITGPMAVSQIRGVTPSRQGRKAMGRSVDDPAVAVSSFGISISRKVSKRAVVRNRIKRQIKAIIRQHLPNISPGWQVVIVVRPAAVECKFDDFLRELEKIFRKLKILNLK